MRAEGWYRDPYKLHTDRWFSDGVPTDLVRDGRNEAKDPAPDAPVPTPLVEADSVEAADGDDLRRADDPTSADAYDAKEANERVFDSLPWGPVN